MDRHLLLSSPGMLSLAVLKTEKTKEKQAHNSRSVVHVPRSSELAVDVGLKQAGVVDLHLRDFRACPPPVLDLYNANPMYIPKKKKGTKHISEQLLIVCLWVDAFSYWQ